MQEKTHKNKYIDNECQLYKPAFISRSLSTSISLSEYPGSWNQSAVNFLLRARRQSSFPFNLHLTNLFPQLQLLLLLSSASQMQFHWALPVEGHFTNIYPFFTGSIYSTESHPESYIERTGWARGRLRPAMSICKKNPLTYPNDFSKYNGKCRMDPTWDSSSNHSQQYIQPLRFVQSQDSWVRHSREIFFLQEKESCRFSLESCRIWNSPDSGCSLGFEKWMVLVNHWKPSLHTRSEPRHRISAALLFHVLELQLHCKSLEAKKK